MRKLSSTASLFALVALCGVVASSALAASGATFSGDRTLIVKFRLDDGTHGDPGYSRARWTTATPVKAILRVRDSSGRLVETLIGGNPYSDIAALTWLLPSGQLVNHSATPAGVYRLTLTMTALAPGMVSQLTNRAATAAWTAKLLSGGVK